MQVIVIAQSGLGDVFDRQFERRGREVQRVSELDALEPTSDCLMIDAAPLQALQQYEAGRIDLSERRNFWQRCARQGAAVMLLTDGRVFDGSDSKLHRETDSPQPGSVCGGQLLALERALAASADRHVILRTGPLIGASGDNPLTRVVAALVQGRELAADANLKMCPTYAEDLARVVSGLTDQVACGADNWGLYHYNSYGAVTGLEFAEAVYAQLTQHIDLGNDPPQLISNDKSRLLTPAVPQLACDKILSHYGIKSLPWRSYLPLAVKSICEEHFDEQ